MDTGRPAFAPAAEVYGTGGEIRPDFIPADRFAEDEIWKLEKQRLWPRVWQMACRDEQIPNVGDYILYEIYDESIVIVRSKADEIKAFYNVCQHRGRRLLDKPTGNINGFYCRFHGWKYDLQGANTHVYHHDAWKDCPEFTADNLALKQPRCESWAGWLWINMDPTAESLRSYLGHVFDMLDPFDMQDLRVEWHEIVMAPVNWKVILEAFHEGYHSSATHISRIEYKPLWAPAHAYGRHAMYFTDVFESLPRAKREDGTWQQTKSMAELLYYQYMELNQSLKAMIMPPMLKAVTRLRDECDANTPNEKLFTRLWELSKEELEATGVKWPPRLTMEHQGATGASWHVFPNTIILPAADGALIYRTRPHGNDPDESIFDIWCLRRYPEGKAPMIEAHVSHGWEEARSRNAFLQQDFDNISAVNAGMKSRGFPGARTSPKEELTTVNFRRTIDDYLREPG